jgi:hypothetical protein
VASYFKDCVGSVAFVAQAGNIVPFLVLAALSAMRPFMAYAPILGLFAGFIVSGWICSFLFNVVISAANGERELPELSITDGLFDSIVVPTFKFAASWAIVLLPALIYAIVAQVDSLAQTNPGDVVFYVLMAAGALFWPMTVLILAIGGAGSFGRPDLIFKTIARTFGPYLFTCLMAGAAFAVFWFVRIGLARTGAIESRLALACVLEVVQLYFEIVVMRFVGLYYYHFKSRFAWSWE